MGRRKALPPRYFWLSALAMICLHYGYPLARIIGYPWNLLGLIPILVGLYVNMWCSNHFKRVGTTVKPFEESALLVTGGPFRLSRHPMYVGMTLALLGLLIIVGTVAPAVVVPVFVWLMHRQFVVPEERALQEKFGQDYVSYKARVRQWL